MPYRALREMVDRLFRELDELRARTIAQFDQEWREHDEIFKRLEQLEEAIRELKAGDGDGDRTRAVGD